MDRIFLSEAKLKGYRTIKDLSVKFNPGLNIIIGKNGSGKTNFLTFLNSALTYELKDLVNCEAMLEFRGEEQFEVRISKSLKRGISNISDSLDIENLGIVSFSIEDKNSNLVFTSFQEFLKSSDEIKYRFDSLFVPHGLESNDDYKFIASPLSYEIKDSALNILNSFNPFTDTTAFYLKRLSIGLINQLLEFYKGVTIDSVLLEDVKRIIPNYFTLYCEFLNSSISDYLPIKKVRLSSTVKFYYDENNSSVKTEGIIMEYLVNESWLPFSSLSDGTKRMLLIFIEVISPFSFSKVVVNAYNYSSKIILLEEPELGIHPHQFEQIMTFLKKMSKDVQIILTTHSPQALDILSKDELDALHICEYHPETGTTLTSLSQSQIDKAKAYMDSDMYLSDYWRYSDLEK